MDAPGSRDLDRTSRSVSSFTFSNRFSRRTRVSLACCRCKARKSKCNGTRPSCSGCLTAAVECQYPHTSQQPSKAQYIRALEDHIIELEKHLRQSGPSSYASPPNTACIVQPHQSPLGPSFGHDAEADGADGLTALIRDLSCDSGGIYIGPSSNIFMGKIMASVAGNRKPEDAGGSIDLGGQSLKSAYDADVFHPDPILLTDVDQNVADRLYWGYLQHISTRWPIIHTPFIAELHCLKDELTDPGESVLLHLVYANGGRYLETTGEKGDFSPERHYRAATESLDLIVGGRDIRAIQVLLLLGIYSLRSPKMPGAWNFVGLALRTCVELGLHRRHHSSQLSGLEDQLRSRIFWSAYVLDRQTSLALGRPFAIPDHDIDADLPLNVNEEAREVNPDGIEDTLAPTTMACFRHTIKIRQLESQIKDTIYRLDKDANSISPDTISWFEAKLIQWRDSIPPPCSIRPELGPRPYDGHDYYLHFYYNCLRQLYLPMVLSRNPTYVEQCAEACVGVCEIFKKLHRNSVVGYSLWALQAVFLAGITLIYTIWVQPANLSSQRSSNALNDCTVILYIVVERWPLAKKYRDAFEELKESLDMLLQNVGQDPKQTLPVYNSAAIRQVFSEVPGMHNYEQMVHTMAGRADDDVPMHSVVTREANVEMGIDLNNIVASMLQNDTEDLFAFDHSSLTPFRNE